MLESSESDSKNHFIEESECEQKTPSKDAIMSQVNESLQDKKKLNNEINRMLSDKKSISMSQDAVRSNATMQRTAMQMAKDKKNVKSVSGISAKKKSQISRQYYSKKSFESVCTTDVKVGFIKRTTGKTVTKFMPTIEHIQNWQLVQCGDDIWIAHNPIETRKNIKASKLSGEIVKGDVYIYRECENGIIMPVSSDEIELIIKNIKS